MVTGSTVTNESNEFSDTDLILFSSNLSYFYTEIFNFKSLKIQTINIPLSKVEKILHKDYISGNGIYLDMIAKGLPLNDTYNYLPKLINYCKNLIHSGPPVPNHKMILMKRLKVTDLLLDIKGSNNYLNSVFSCIDLVNLSVDLNLYYNRRWRGGSGKHKMKQLIKFDKSWGTRIVDGLEYFFNHKDPTRLLKIIESNLDFYGGANQINSINSGHTEVVENFLIIEINSQRLKARDSINLAFQIKESIKSIKNNEFYFFLSNNSDSTIDNNLYLVIIKDADFLNSKVLPFLNETIISNKINSRQTIRFPVQMDVQMGLGGTTTYFLISKILSFLTLFVVKNQNRVKPVPSFILGIEFLQILKAKLFSTEEEFYSFLEFIFEVWFIFSLNDKKIYGQNQIELAKSFKLKQFRKLFNQQFPKLFSSFKDKNIKSLEKDFPYNCLLELKNVKDDKIILHPGYLYSFKYFSDNNTKKRMILYKNFLFKALSTLMIQDKDKPYLIYFISNILNKLI